MLRIATSAAAVVPRTSSRALHSAPPSLKNVTGKVSEVADTVNKKLGKGLASMIETGEAAVESTKSTLGAAAETMKHKTQHEADATRLKLNEMEGKAHGAKDSSEKK